MSENEGMLPQRAHTWPKVEATKDGTPHPRYPHPVFLWLPRKLTNGKIRWLCTVNRRWWRDRINGGTPDDSSGWIYEAQ